MKLATAEFLAAVTTLITRRLHDMGEDLCFTLVAWDREGPQYVGGDERSPSETVDMLHAAAYIVLETHEREEGHA